MKHKFLLIAFVLASFSWITAKANETEPNNDAAHANTLALNGTNNGDLSPAADVDWWKVTTTGDGAVNLSLSSTDGRYIYFDMYDTAGVIALHTGTYTNGTTNYTVDGLAKGTYFIRIYCFYGTDTGRYTITNTLTVPSQPNDVEPNNSRAQAIALPLNSSKTGHVNYYYNNKRDTSDWYKITTNADGRLRLTMTSANGQNVWAYLYDNNGTTLLAGNYTSGSAVVVNADGLAAGTYYVKINTYYGTEFAPYTISDSLFTTSIANDPEPDSTKALALTLPLNASVTGHVNYYYNNHKDSVDWYKITTVADGRIRLTMTSANGQNVWAYLYDNNGTTLIASNYTSGSAVVVNADGLSAGTYYIRVNTYYTTEFAPYTLADSVFSPTQANDPEPDSTKALALTLPVNGTVTGHVNYYYNNHKDSVDWYKLTTTADANINISLQSNNGQYVWAYLFDNNGTTVINSAYTNSTTSFNTDGLQAGTYYVRINTYYTTDFAPYTLTNTVTPYTFANDGLNNNKPYQAATLGANIATPGHVGFYYNNQRDSLDWWKINYTGSGALTVTTNFEPNQINGYQYTWMYIYKDTNAAPIYGNYVLGSSISASFTGLTQGYYWVRIITYYNDKFESYTITPTFTQANIAKLKLVAATSAIDCSSTNSLTLKCSGSQAPYTVQLSRYGVAYGSPRIVTNTRNFTYANLPSGVYTATVFGDGATGTAFGTLKATTLAPVPTNLTVTNITGTTAKLNWTAQTGGCVNYYSVQYRVLGSPTWITKKTNGPLAFYNVTGLALNTSYEWHVAPADSLNSVIGVGTYSALDTFTTAIAFAGAQTADESVSKTIAGNNNLTIYPNPVKSFFTIQFTSSKPDSKVAASLKDMYGNIVWSTNNSSASTLNGSKVDASALASGIYILQVTDLSNNTTVTKKVVVSK